eukprot:gnl/Hemi2/27048_TR9088_c0_g13_i1.p1 gnl/Hemi2/27048_TR9088_c0_g13~~gnl/Hemi2/27048_TR9088_c0_g13_i1.p1  ORF type:complete len:2026 (-),score=439.80 gnl/Hemi2/27048_TR9088_c0_g13_i1:73-6150(-)
MPGKYLRALLMFCSSVLLLLLETSVLGQPPQGTVIPGQSPVNCTGGMSDPCSLVWESASDETVATSLWSVKDNTGAVQQIPGWIPICPAAVSHTPQLCADWSSLPTKFPNPNFAVSNTVNDQILVNGSFRADGWNYQLTLAPPPNQTAVFSVSFYIYITGGPRGEWRAVIHKGGAPWWRVPAIWLFPWSNNLHCRISTWDWWNNGVNSVTELKPFTTTHVAYVLEMNMLKLYLNGTLDNSVTLAYNYGISLNTNGWYIGNSPWSPAFQGYLGNMIFFARPLPPGEVAIMGAAPAPPGFPPVKFTATDTVLIPGNLQCTGSVAAEIQDLGTYESTTFSLMFWMWLNQGPTGPWRGIFHKGNIDWQRTPAMWLWPGSNNIHARISLSTDQNAGIMASNQQIPLNQAVHIAYVADTSQLRLYINGYLDSSYNYPSGAFVMLSQDMWHLGASPWYSGMNGWLYNMTYFARAVTDPEILAASTPAPYDFPPGNNPRPIPCPQNCIDPIHGTCDFSRGNCSCNPPFYVGPDGNCAYAHCPNDCIDANHGSCNNLTGVCTCVSPFILGSNLDCSVPYILCPNNCTDLAHGTCNTRLGQCVCSGLHTLGDQNDCSGTPYYNDEGWMLVRHVRPNNTPAWHPADDHLAGTAWYGHYVSLQRTTNVFTMIFSNLTWDEMMVSTGDMTSWLIFDRTQLSNTGNFTATIKRSSLSPVTPYTALWLNRPGYGSDPWISLKDHDADSETTMLYAGNGAIPNPVSMTYTYTANQTALLNSHHGANVWIRTAPPPVTLSASVIENSVDLQWSSRVPVGLPIPPRDTICVYQISPGPSGPSSSTYTLVSFYTANRHTELDPFGKSNILTNGTGSYSARYTQGPHGCWQNHSCCDPAAPFEAEVLFSLFLPPPACAKVRQFVDSQNTVGGWKWLICEQGFIIKSVDFASFGTPQGVCGNFTQSICHSALSVPIVQSLCLGKSVCMLNASEDIFGDPCINVPNKNLYVQVSCALNRSPPTQPTDYSSATDQFLSGNTAIKAMDSCTFDPFHPHDCSSPLPLDAVKAFCNLRSDCAGFTCKANGTSCQLRSLPLTKVAFPGYTSYFKPPGQLTVLTSDIMLVVDRSSNVALNEWKELLDFVEGIVSSVQCHAFGLVTYGRRTFNYLDQPLTTNKNVLMDLLADYRSNSWWTNHTGDGAAAAGEAVMIAQKELDANGSPDRHRVVVLIMTRPSNDGPPPEKVVTQYRYPYENVEFFVVSVGMSGDDLVQVNRIVTAHQIEGAPYTPDPPYWAQAHTFEIPTYKDAAQLLPEFLSRFTVQASYNGLPVPHTCLSNCSFHGFCNTSNGVCICDEGWEGVFCEAKSCPNNCAKRGACDLHTGTCNCFQGWYGLDCASHLCPNNCSDHGQCHLPTGKCICEPGRMGIDCSELACPGNCNNQGWCDAVYGTCMCYLGYMGERCEMKQCPMNCSQRGVCNFTTGACNCYDRYTGKDCSILKCPLMCSGNGVYSGDSGICVCNPGWQGVGCSDRICPHECYGHGVCNLASGACTCHRDWTGAACSSRVCMNNCSGNGRCDTSSGDCYCNSGWTDVDCSGHACPSMCSGHGQCDLTSGTCTCMAGWYPDDCSMRHCPYDCSNANGKCNSSTGVCACAAGWGGIGCQEHTCPNGCSGRGVCNKQTGNCTCPDGWSFDDCSGKLCPLMCSGHGTCNSTDGTCLCQAGWVGNACADHVCLTDCSNGYCSTATGTCICDAGFIGDDCSLRTCPQNCNGNGNCDNTTGVCCCFDGWRGTNCSGKLCHNDCNKRGICDYLFGTCICDPQWQGVECDVPRCPKDCSGHGTCDHTSAQCRCNTPFSGSDCTYISCPQDCSGHGDCDLHTGLCSCGTAWHGPDCSVGCPVGQYLQDLYRGTDLTGSLGPLTSSCLLGPNLTVRWEDHPPMDPNSKTSLGTVCKMSARWSGNFLMNKGKWVIYGRAKDGMRLYLDGREVVDQWYLGEEPFEFSFTTPTSKLHAIEVEWYNACKDQLYGFLQMTVRQDDGRCPDPAFSPKCNKPS